MRRILSTLLSRFLPRLKTVSPEAGFAIRKAGQQQAMFQMELPLGGNKVHHHYLTLSSHTACELTLETGKPCFTAQENWTGRVFQFRFLMQPDLTKPPLLHKFKSRIIKVLTDERTIVVAMPREIIATEQRRNVRIALKPMHMPHVVVWGIRKDEEESGGARFHHHVILDLEACQEETRRTVRNISAGGVCLALHPEVLAENKPWLEPGRRLLVQLVFNGKNHPRPSRHMFVAKVSNTRTEGRLRPELGIQFLASRVSGPSPAWKTLGRSGCEELARVFHAIQLIYYAEIKQRLAVRECVLREPHKVCIHGRRPV